MIHTVKGFGIVNKAEIDVFLELSCVFNDPADVGNLISVLCDNLEGWHGVGNGSRVQQGGDMWLIHVYIWQKSTQYYKAIIFQLKQRERNTSDGLPNFQTSDGIQPKGGSRNQSSNHVNEVCCFVFCWKNLLTSNLYGFPGRPGDKRPKTRLWVCTKSWNYNPAQGWKIQRTIPSENRLGEKNPLYQPRIYCSLDFGIKRKKTSPLEFITTSFPSHSSESSNL